MSSTVLNPASSGGGLAPISPVAVVAGGGIASFSLAAVASAAATYTASAAAPQGLSGTFDQVHLKTNMANAFTLSGVRFDFGGAEHIVKANGDVHRGISPVTGNGTMVGTLAPGAGELTLTAWPAASGPAVTGWRAIAGAPINGADTPFQTYGVTFRIATAPIKPSSFSLLGTMADGTTFNVTADADGVINTTRVKGKINYNTGVVRLVFTAASGTGGQTQTDLSYLGISGLTNAYIDLVRQETLRYNAVAYSYLPLDKDLLGIDPVRLPSDGRVPIFRAGRLAVVGHTATTTPATGVVSTPINAGRTRLSRVRLLGANNLVIETGYTEDLEAGTLTPTNVTGWSQPVRMEHRIEDMALIRSVDIDGSITFTRPLTHNFPEGSYVSSCLRAGDMFARVPLAFDQATWDGTTFSDVLAGSAAPGTYNLVGYPIEVTNAGAITEKWALKFKTSSTFDIIGEHVGNIGDGSINVDCSPINAITGEPYFTILADGWGVGWAGGNVQRINTVGAMFPVWMVRTVQQGPEAAADYSFLTLVRGDVDNPTP
jgi:hypothetical protein